MPPVSDGTGHRHAAEGERASTPAGASCAAVSLARTPFTIEPSTTTTPSNRTIWPYCGLRLLGIEGTYRVVDAAQSNDLKNFDFDMTVSRF